MANTLIQLYPMFGGRYEEALKSYRTALDARIDRLMRFQESPDSTPPGMLPPCFGMLTDRSGISWMIKPWQPIAPDKSGISILALQWRR